MEKWAIQTKGFQESDSMYEYYTGESYVVQEEIYIASSRDKTDAKQYTSQNRALSAMKKIKYNFSNSWSMRVVSLEDKS